MEHSSRRVSYVFLCMTPFFVVPLAAARALRVPGVFQGIGAVLFAAICVAAWNLGARAIASGAESRKTLAMAGAFLLGPIVLMALLWIGVGGPWEATPAENQMRYFVLGLMAIAVTSGFIALNDALREAGPRVTSTLGFSAAVLGGSAYLVWSAFMFGLYSAGDQAEKLPAAVASFMSDATDLLLFYGGVLTYLATAAFAASLARVGWLGRRSSRVYLVANLLALLCLFARGLEYPNPTAFFTPWYAGLGFIAGIPAIPWIMPYLLGVVLLRRAGDEQR